MTNTEQTKTIADRLGRRAMADALGVGQTAVSNRVVEGRFPASWVKVLQYMCAVKGIDCPDELFGIKPVPPKVDTPPASFKGEADTRVPTEGA